MANSSKSVLNTSDSNKNSSDIKNTKVSDMANSATDNVDRINIDTEAVWSLACDMENLNNDISDKFSNLYNNVIKLEETWGASTVCNKVSVAIRKIKEQSTSRYNQFEDYVNCVRNIIVKGYEETEDQNTSLSDSFR